MRTKDSTDSKELVREAEEGDHTGAQYSVKNRPDERNVYTEKSTFLNEQSQ